MQDHYNLKHPHLCLQREVVLRSTRHLPGELVSCLCDGTCTAQCNRHRAQTKCILAAWLHASCSAVCCCDVRILLQAHATLASYLHSNRSCEAGLACYTRMQHAGHISSCTRCITHSTSNIQYHTYVEASKMVIELLQ